jgi:hypothetical protein
LSGRYSIGIQGSQVNVALDESLTQQDVEDMLAFKPEDVEHLLRTHSGNQSYWEALSIRLSSRHEKFVDVWAKKWWAHSNTYAREVLAAYGDSKPTGPAVQDMAVQIYAADTSEVERKKYAVQAHDFAVKKRFVGTFDEYYMEMYKYQMLKPPWYFETVSETGAKLKEDADLVKSIASKLNDKSFHLAAYAKAFMAKYGNVGPMSLSEAAIMEAVGGYRKS